MEVELRPARDEDIPELARLVAAIASYHESIDSRARFDWDEIRDAPNWLKAVLHRTIMRCGSPTTARAAWSVISGYICGATVKGICPGSAAILATLTWM